jgi:hypothetical protein
MLRVAISNSIVLPFALKSLAKTLIGISTRASPPTLSTLFPSLSKIQPSELQLKPLNVQSYFSLRLLV